MNKTAQRSDIRRQALLETALLVFARFGYRKASMDEVAQAANVSRQGLYLHFASKEDLFRATVLHALSSQYEKASAILAGKERTLEEKFVAALDEWMGRYVGIMKTDAADIVEASGKLSSEIFTEYETLFLKALARAVNKSSLLQNFRSVRISGAEFANTLYCTAIGIKRRSESRSSFVQNLRLAANIFVSRRHGP